MKLTFVDNWEANNAHKDNTTQLLEGMSPDTTDVLYKVVDLNFADELTQGETAKYILEEEGLDVTASFDDASVNTDKVMFSIPQANENGFSDYITYIQQLVGPALNLLRLNTLNKFELHKLGGTTTTNRGTRDERLILKDSFSSKVAYEDVFTEVIFKSEYDTQVGSSYDNLIRNITFKAANADTIGRQKTKRISHIFLDISSFTSTLVEELATVRTEYTFSTATSDLETLVGDKITISFRDVLNNTRSIEGTVIKLNKSINKTRITVAYGGGF